MRIVCQQTILMKYHILFFLKIKMSQTLSPAAVVIGALRVNLVINSSDRLEKPGIKLATPGLQEEWFIHYTTVPPLIHPWFDEEFNYKCVNVTQMTSPILRIFLKIEVLLKP